MKFENFPNIAMSQNSSASKIQSDSFGNLNYKDEFTNLDVNTRGLLKDAFNVLRAMKTDKNPKSDWDNCETHINGVVFEVRKNIAQMKSISSDINMAQAQKNVQPHVIERAKTFSSTVANLQDHLRKLQMEFQHTIISKEREDLFTVSTSPFEEQFTRRRHGTAGEVSSGTTDSLFYSQKVLMETVARSAGTLEQLAQSSNAIINNQDELLEQNSAVGVSKKLMGKYGRREWTDKLLICLALMFFFACVFYIFQKRIF